MKIYFKYLYIVLISLILLFNIRGISGNPTKNDINLSYWKDNGPFELSPERGRFALLYSIVEDRSPFFSVPLARFVTPDLGYINGKYVSLFAPAVSYLAIPGYLIGKFLGASQVGAFATSSLFALFNIILVRGIAKKLGASEIASNIAASIFLFASPAFAYSTTLYQHHISTFLILFSIYSLITWNNLFSVGLVWFLFAASIPVDYPNLFLMIPIVIFSIGKIILIKKDEHFVSLKMNYVNFLLIFALILPLFFFFWFNKTSYGNPLQLSGTVTSVDKINEYGNPIQLQSRNDMIQKIQPEEKQSALNLFETRNSLNGLYILLVSKERGIFVFTPVMIFSVIGMFIFYRKRIAILPVLIGIIGFNILLYSMWGDPWGGWAFGSRYLIPSYAIMAILISLVLDKFRKRNIFVIIFFLLMSYSVSVNTLGALTTNKIPPKAEAIALEIANKTIERYSFNRNWEFLQTNGIRSFVYQTYLSKIITPQKYYFYMTSVIIFVIWVQLVSLYFKKDRNNL